MNTETAIYSVFGFIVGWTWWGNFSKARKYRKLWIESQEARVIVAAERDEWTKTAWKNHEALAQEKIKRAGLKKIITDQASEIDSLVHGDKRCTNGHRFYLGVKCPHCASDVIGDCGALCSICLISLRFGDEMFASTDGGVTKVVCRTCAERTKTIA